ncbi:MAG: DNA polymerase [Ruthenibacterium lactatiformans]
MEQGRENGYVTTLYGRRRTLPELASSNFNVRSLGERMAMNTPSGYRRGYHQAGHGARIPPPDAEGCAPA